MRKIRKVSILVSENFYNKLNQERKEFDNEIRKNVGITKEVSFPSYTELIAMQKKKLLNLNTGVFKNAKQKRRCI